MKKILLILILVGLILPASAGAIIRIENPLGAKTFQELIGNIINLIFTIAVVIAPAMIIVGAFYFLTAGGNPQGIETGKKIILWTIIGFVVIMLAWGAIELLKEVFEVKEVKNEEVPPPEKDVMPPVNDIPLALSSIVAKHYTLANPRITPEEIFRFNPAKDSGWFYIAQTIPENGIAFWAAPMRTRSRTPTDDPAPLLYGITNINTGEYYAGFLPHGSFSESAEEINLFYQLDGEKLIEFRQTKADLSEFKLKVNLPWNGDFFQLERTLTLSRPILYPSGDGIIPMAEGIESLYASIVTDQGFWIDFQKFDVRDKPLPREANHRWGSFILNKPVGPLPAGTIGVGWEILDENNQRQPGGFTNVDLMVPDFGQFTATDAHISMGEIEVIETWDSNNKTYLRKWKMRYPGNLELLFETVIPNQENEVKGHYFYEGMIRVIDPKTGEVVGTGMLEQTHDEVVL